uniref:Uncharacterized protein LOC104239737 n=1 Tax=Nicotiana sylvestris TaxID=4096 RepID=A0A1U7XPE8_NICSY|nr:PREDICTED: uncharacterized protein LOC104239737 [Nicotiana sylvestris]
MSAYITHLISRLDPLKYILQKPMPTGKLTKCKILLSKFDIVYKTQKAIKGQALAGHLAENSVDGDYEPLLRIFLMKRIQNEFVDALATLSSMVQHPNKKCIDLIEVEIKDQHAYCFNVDEEPDGKPCYHDIRRFLATREYPENATNSQKRTQDLGLLRYVDVVEATKLLEETHAGMCGPHMNRFTLAKTILRARYFWMTMENDSICYVQKCHKCQIHEDFIRVLLNELNVMGSPWSFVVWGMDMIGPIKSAVSNGHHFIMVAIDYFTKWVETSTYKAVIKKVVADFF